MSFLFDTHNNENMSKSVWNITPLTNGEKCVTEHFIYCTIWLKVLVQHYEVISTQYHKSVYKILYHPWYIVLLCRHCVCVTFKCSFPSSSFYIFTKAHNISSRRMLLEYIYLKNWFFNDICKKAFWIETLRKLTNNVI